MRLARGGWTRLSLGLLGLGALLMIATATLIVLVVTGYFDTVAYSTPETGTAFNVSSIVQPGTPLAAPASGNTSPITRLLIPAIGVDAPVVVKGIGADGVMQVPDNAYDVAWYDFSAHPESGGNIVFSGHVDFHGVGPAVFWKLGKLKKDDAIELRLADGSVYRYQVTGMGSFDAATAPVARIVGATDVESVTLITCTGTFNAATHQYDKRLVVQAQRSDVNVPGTVTAGTPAP